MYTLFDYLCKLDNRENIEIILSWLHVVFENFIKLKKIKYFSILINVVLFLNKYYGKTLQCKIF